MKLKLILLLFFAALVRWYGIAWDQGFHLHPDERMLIMVADRITFFNQLDPQFFNYGSLPIYILKAITQFMQTVFSLIIANYDGMLWAGRYLSIIADTATVFMIYLISKHIFKKETTALWSGFFYTVAFFPIQNAHFFVVDVFLTLAVTCLIYYCLLYGEKPTFRRALGISISLAAALAIKFTAVLFIPCALIAIVTSLLITHKKTTQYTIASLLMFVASTLLFHFVFMPYAYISSTLFIKDITEQTTMNSNPYIFPYTLQYVYTIPYLYYLKNIVLWGLGPFISILSSVGIVLLITKTIAVAQQIKDTHLKKKISTLMLKVCKEYFPFFVLSMFFTLYCIVIGKSAVKFMRYMLPMYPLLAFSAGYAFQKIYEYTKDLIYIRFLPALTILIVLLWSASFINIYSQPHTRITASNWINEHIPTGSTIAVEHWDDRLPINGSERYNMIELTLYDRPDDQYKWALMNQKLQAADYIVIASNRLYVPLQKLDDCSKYISCYPITSQYYKALFDGKLPFKKVAEFSVYPNIIPSFSFTRINDQTADESFTVYDHPRILIYKHIRPQYSYVY